MDIVGIVSWAGEGRWIDEDASAAGDQRHRGYPGGKKNSGYIAIGRYPDDTLNYARRACQRGLERVNEWLGYGGT